MSIKNMYFFQTMLTRTIESEVLYHIYKTVNEMNIKIVFKNHILCLFYFINLLITL